MASYRESKSSGDQQSQGFAPFAAQIPVEAGEWQSSVSSPPVLTVIRIARVPILVLIRMYKVGPLLDRFKEDTFGDATRTQWHLQRLGIRPNWQGKGVGTALIEEVRRKASTYTFG